MSLDFFFLLVESITTLFYIIDTLLYRTILNSVKHSTYDSIYRWRSLTRPKEKYGSF
ncbi:hypothetical protein GLOIN_2v1660522, partial [Rhizophagus irregularis DAOM 181602=DAOM 197198]